jgi:hypothetical protein
MAKGDDIEERLIDFAVRVIRLSSELPMSEAGRHVGRQLLRSGMARPRIMLKREVLRAQMISYTSSRYV